MLGQHSGQGAAGQQAGSPPMKRGRPSGPSRRHSFVRFVNKTNRRVDVIWLNYEGLGVKYSTLGRDQFLNVNTFVGHPWIFRDGVTGERMVVNFQTMYEPAAWNRDDGWPPQRKIVYITLPVFTLLERSLQVVRSLVPRDSIRELEIPTILHTALLYPTVDVTVASTVPASQNTAQQQQPQQQQQQQQQHNANNQDNG